MSDDKTNTVSLLDRATAEIRGQELAPDTEDAITARVWDHIVAEGGPTIERDAEIVVEKSDLLGAQGTGPSAS